MKLYNKYVCGGCGQGAVLADVMTPPTADKQAEEKPCSKCGKTNWVPVKTSGFAS